SSLLHDSVSTPLSRPAVAELTGGRMTHRRSKCYYVWLHSPFVVAILAQYLFFVKMPSLAAAPSSSVLAIRGSSVGHTWVLSPADGSRLQPQDVGGEHHHRLVIDGTFLVAVSQPTSLLGPM